APPPQVRRSKAAAGISEVSPTSMATTGRRCAWWNRPADSRLPVRNLPGMVFGGSSGAGLALQAAARYPAISKLAVWGPPYHADGSAPRLNSPAWLINAGKTVARSIRGAVHRVLDGQTHNVFPTALASELLEFFNT